MRYEDILARWAEAEYGLPEGTVTDVDFEDSVGYGGYCETCQYEYTYCSVTVYHRNAGGRVVSFTREGGEGTSTADYMRSVTEFAVRLLTKEGQT